MKEYGLEAPVIEADEHWFAITFKRNTALKGLEKRIEKGSVIREKTRVKTRVKSSQKGSQKSSQKSSQKIIAAMIENNAITIEELAAQLGITDRAIKKNIARLKDIGAVRRIGPDKGGHWDVK